MKKAYKKPEIMFESFASSVNIAGDCEVSTDTPNSGYCGIEFSVGDILFMDIPGTECTPDYRLTPEAGWEDVDASYPWAGKYDTLCYHVPYGANLFNS